MDALRRYAESLDQVGSKLVIVSANERIIEQLAITGITAVIGEHNVYPGDERVGATIARAEAAFAGRGRTLVRYSGTENKIRLLVECEDTKMAEEQVEKLREAAVQSLCD